MCEKCVEFLQKYFPELPEKEAITLLLEETSFPFGSFETVEKQLMEIYQNKQNTNLMPKE
jgi:hypothetical protein